MSPTRKLLLRLLAVAAVLGLIATAVTVVRSQDDPLLVAADQAVQGHSFL